MIVALVPCIITLDRDGPRNPAGYRGNLRSFTSFQPRSPSLRARVEISFVGGSFVSREREREKPDPGCRCWKTRNDRGGWWRPGMVSHRSCSIIVITTRRPMKRAFYIDEFYHHMWPVSGQLPPRRRWELIREINGHGNDPLLALEILEIAIVSLARCDRAREKFEGDLYSWFCYSWVAMRIARYFWPRFNMPMLFSDSCR